ARGAGRCSGRKRSLRAFAIFVGDVNTGRDRMGRHPEDDMPEPGSTVRTSPPAPRRRGRALPILLVVVVLLIGLAALYVWSALSFSYSDGERAGYVQKFSRKGWLCKTWE